MQGHDYEKSVFINCPFDHKVYDEIFDAMVFAIHDCGFVAKCAKEIRDSGQIRIIKILTLIEACKFGIHDISLTELDECSGLPRFNMPLELGFFIACKTFGQGRQKEKLTLVLDKEKHRHQIFCSDIAGQDVAIHDLNPIVAIKRVRDWISDSVDEIIPSSSKIAERYRDFVSSMPVYSEALKLDPDELTFIDYRNLVAFWLKENSW